MTTENPWLTGGSDQEPTNAERDSFESLGLGLVEESPTVERVTPVVSQGPIAAITPHTSVPRSGSDLMTLPPTTSTELVATSRRALRDAQRATLVVRRPWRAPTPGRTDTVRSVAGASVVAAPVVSAPVMLAPVVAARVVSRVPFSRRIAKKTFPPVVMVAIAALLVGTSVPANALFDPEAPPASLALSSLPAERLQASDSLKLDDQVLQAKAGVELAATAASRAEWGVTSYAEMLRLRYGSTNYAYATSGSGAIRWPFPFAARIASAFGDRAAPCRGCSSYHRGLDFDAGYGAPVGAIADGVVTTVGYAGTFGYAVEIEHIINGQKVTSLYAHMIDNSSALVVGAPVVAGEIVGAIGNTGLSTGPHLHLEIHLDGVPVDPFAWLMANAG